MDDERIERALRLGPPDEPVYSPRGHWQPADGVDQPSELRPATSATGGPYEPGGPEVVPIHPIGVRVRDARQPSRRSYPMTIAASLTLLIGLLLAAQLMPSGPAATPRPSLDRLARLMAAGSIDIAVSSGAPQTVSQGGAHIGFDIDVAKAIARQLGLRANVTPVAPDGFGSTSWDLALAGHAGQSLAGLESSVPYAWWPVWLAVPEASAVTGVAGLTGVRVCVVTGSAGADWVAGDAPGAGATAPPGVVPVAMASDDDCISAVAGGEANALLTATLLPDELTARGLRVVGSSPVLIDPWVASIRGPGADASALLEAVNKAIVTLRTTGDLADLSRSSFGGLDVTVQP